MKKTLFWPAVFLLILVSLVLWENVAWAMILMATGVAIAIGELHGRYKADKEYRRNPEAARLIGRYSEGIDHKGRRTGKIIR